MKFKVENLTTRYYTSDGLVHALEDVNFSLDDGESLGIAGESACGKSTLGLSIIRMILNGKINSGKIIFDQKSILDISESDFNNDIRWKKISMVFQGAMNSLDPVFSINDQFVLLDQIPIVLSSENRNKVIVIKADKTIDPVSYTHLTLPTICSV